MALEIRKATGARDLAFCVQIRTLVFVVGQNVPRDREVDADEGISHYFIAVLDGLSVGTVRWRAAEKGIAKIERLAVLDEAQGRGIGAALMRAVIDELKSMPAISKIKLGSQDHAIPFYEKLGFKICGDGYMDGGGIPHHDMVRTP